MLNKNVCFEKHEKSTFFLHLTVVIINEHSTKLKQVFSANKSSKIFIFFTNRIKKGLKQLVKRIQSRFNYVKEGYNGTSARKK